ncbi:vacuolar sorting receptor 3 [Stylonychia lemnae]|uniref:Vacuolar sorting receptor 3 n=1 Tax=Stylonychia lemnae TaxID=5949 RepID=A0A078AFC6_STYLE|nr:vacuolar sorting receptor 3 [Stylonychia lemnae]|eukprot:CDW80556.1 vacuolar sorting receptor 3 [Stylonychia lemnae]
MEKYQSLKSMILLALLGINLELSSQRLQILSPTQLQGKFTGKILQFNIRSDQMDQSKQAMLTSAISHTATLLQEYAYINQLNNLKQIGRLYYDADNHYGCKEFSHQDFQVDYDGDITPFYIVERGGGCSFVTKVRNLENIEVSVVIIVNDSDKEVEDIVLSDDGTGGGIRIPSMIITKTDGKKLIDFVKRASQTELDQLALMAEFMMEKPDNRVEYDLWFTSSNDRALDFITDFQQYDQKFGDKVLFTPHYVFWKCPYCEKKYLDNDCYANGKYCAVDPQVNMTGREIIQEDLRQKCIYDKVYGSNKNRFMWWTYIKYVHYNCYSTINADCSKNAHQKLGLDFQETQKCVADSFSDSNWDLSTTTNKVIDSEIDYWKQYGSGIFPSIVINNRTYRGQIESLAVFNAICAGFEIAPNYCQSTLGSYTPDFLDKGDGIKGSVIVLIVLALIFINFVIVYCYRRHAKRELQQNMQVHIESAVSQYFALSQPKESKSKSYQK